MATKIEWTEATWNPVTGCSKVSAGCTNCYAEKLSHRFGWTNKPWNAAFAAENVTLHPERLDMPEKWRKPRRVFVNSMSDLFHEQVPDEFIAQVFDAMRYTPQHTYQILTKRPERMRKWFSKVSEWEEFLSLNGTPKSYGGSGIIVGEKRRWPLPNVWLGVSVENQQAADERIPLLLQTPAAVRFLSCEPLLGPVSLDRWFGLQDGNEWAECLCDEIDESDRPCITCECRKELGKKSGLDWVIAGGESGPGARPMHPEWARDLRNQCVAAGVPFFFKQWGQWAPFLSLGKHPGEQTKGLVIGDETVWRVGKGNAGRMLDGRAWDEYPTVEAR